MSKEYEVGYGKPPKRTRFEQGKSGNPKGRPKKERGMSTMLRQILNEPMHVTLKGKRRKVSTQTAILLRLTEKSLSGDLRSISTLLSLRAQHLGEEEGVQSTELSEEELQILREAGIGDVGEGDAGAA
jgi:hypothetical protein